MANPAREPASTLCARSVHPIAPGPTPSPEQTTMLTAQAQVKTERPSRYLVQLCRHAGRHGHHPRPPAGPSCRRWGAGPPRIAVTRRLLQHPRDHHFRPLGSVHPTGHPDILTLCLEATDEDKLQRLQEVITRNLERFGRREHLTVTWQQPVPTAACPGAADPAQELHPVPAAQTGRGRRTTVVLAAAVVLGVALAVVTHLGMGAAVLAAWRWVGWTAVGLVAIPVVAVVGHAVVVTVLGVRALAIRRRLHISRSDQQRVDTPRPWW
jgi:hypothetical protein